MNAPAAEGEIAAVERTTGSPADLFQGIEKYFAEATDQGLKQLSTDNDPL